MKLKVIRGGIIRAGRGWVEYEARGRKFGASTPSRLWRSLVRYGVDRIAADAIRSAAGLLLDKEKQ